MYYVCTSPHCRILGGFSEVQLISLTRLDRHVRVRLGGLVMSKSVKFLGKLESSLSDQETREVWRGKAALRFY